MTWLGRWYSSFNPRPREGGGPVVGDYLDGAWLFQSTPP